jgi:hypothetical protein
MHRMLQNCHTTLLVKKMIKQLLVCALALSCTCAWSAPRDFAGRWTIDWRTPQQRLKKIECGTATFDLTQAGDRIAGMHSYATIGCGRLNEGGAVHGIAVGKTAVLVVTSGRNGDIVVGKAKRSGNGLEWEISDWVTATGIDEALILQKGILAREPEAK